MEIGKTNRVVAWSSMTVGIGTGLIMGMWSFDGPLATPAWLGEYDDVSRRLVRLGHIAFIGLAILNLLLVRELPRLALPARRFASVAMNVGNVFLPLNLMAAGLWRPLKYSMPVPALCVFLAVFVVAVGTWRSGEESDVHNE